MDKIYILSSFAIWGMLIWMGLGGSSMFDFDGVAANRPKGPGQHFHK